MYKKFRSAKLDVKNYPVNKLAITAIKLLCCIKGSCDPYPDLGLGAVTDKILDKSIIYIGFMPFVGYTLNK